MLCSVLLHAADEKLVKQQSELGSLENPIIISLLPERRVHFEMDENPLELPGFLKSSRDQNLNFQLIVSESYEQSVADFCSGRTQIAVLSMVTYTTLRKRCDSEALLAIEIMAGQSVYHSAIFTHRKNFFRNNRHLSFHQLENKSIAFGSRYSTTAFHYPLKLLADMQLELPDALGEIYITGSHSAAIDKLVNGEVELAAASFQSWKAAIDDGKVNPILYMPLLKSGSIPLPPIVMNRFMPAKLQGQIRRLFKSAHMAEEPGSMTGLRGRTINRYDLETVQNEDYLASLEGFDALELSLIERILDKAVINEVD